MEWLKDYVPLAQTILWVSLIVGILLRYHSSIESIIESLRKRIDSGGALKLGPVELSELSKPLNPKEQAEKLERDVAQFVEIEQRQPNGVIHHPDLKPETIRTQYAKAEDLALREIQVEYQAAINRQLAIGPSEFDGAFVKDGKFHVVEVKYSRRPLPKAIIEQSTERILSRFRYLNWRSTKLILAVVYDDPEIDLSKEKSRIAEIISSVGKEVEVRCYQLRALAEKFGIAPPLTP
jgi:hypothetical protein